MMNVTVDGPQPDADHVKKPLHGTVEDLLGLIPGPDATENYDPFLTLSGRGALTWLALFAHARRFGNWKLHEIDTKDLELGGELGLTAHWTVQGLGHSMGADRVTAGKGLKELVENGFVRIDKPRNKGQFGGIDFTLRRPHGITQAARHRVSETLKKRGVEYKGYEWRKASRCISEDEIQRVHQDVDLELKAEQADVLDFPKQAEDLAARKVKGKRGLE
jgi:predicted transcriptional regulator